MHRVTISGVPVDAMTARLFIETVGHWSASNGPQRYICYVNAHVHNLARRDVTLQRILQGASICYADGAGVVWAARRFGLPLEKRMTAADFFPELIAHLHQLKRRVYFVGGEPGVAEATATSLATQFPGFAPVGIDHGYWSQDETPALIDRINSAQSDLLILGMGSPLQELWIEKYRSRLQVPLIWSVGALFDYRAGRERRCPPWMGDRGLEWLYRLGVNPRRMASRYLLGNPKFVWAVSREWFARRHSLGVVCPTDSRNEL